MDSVQRLLFNIFFFADLEIMTDYVLDFFAEIPLQGVNGGVSKQKLVWQTLSVTILLHQERKSPLGVVAKVCQYLSSSINGVYQAYSRKKNDVIVRRDLWELLSYFFKLSQELSHGVATIDDLSSLSTLWTMDFYQIFSDAKECGDVRGQQRIDYLSAVTEIVRRLSDVNEIDWQRVDIDERTKWASVIKDRLVRSVRFHLHHWPWSEELAETWFYFIVISLARNDFRLSTVALFNEFVNVSTPNFDSNILCYFLSKLIEKPDVLRRISSADEESRR